MTKKVTWNVMHIAVGLSRGEKCSSRALAPTPICSQAAEQHTDYSLWIQKSIKYIFRIYLPSQHNNVEVCCLGYLALKNEMRHKEYSFNLCRVFLVT